MGSSSSSTSQQIVEQVSVADPALHFVQANAAVDLISFELVDASSGQLGQSLDDKHSLGERFHKYKSN
jgi:hypothetical protein